MGYIDLTETSIWSHYSKRMAEKILSARNVGRFYPADAEEKNMRCIEGRAGSLKNGECVSLSWLVDLSDGLIVDAKFQVFGHSALIAAAEVACDLCVGKNHDQAKRIGLDLIDKALRDLADKPAFPEETYPLLKLVIAAIVEAAEQCDDISLGTYGVSPVPQVSESEGGYPGWLALNPTQKIAIIEEILDREIRPYVELDAGGIEVQELINDKELIIAYKGSCTSCFSAVGTTLSTIQQILQSRVHPDLIVIPNMEGLNF